jgi:hypothetical protein
MDELIIVNSPSLEKLIIQKQGNGELVGFVVHYLAHG